jgi:Holliday junction DNA helicase RuvB
MPKKINDIDASSAVAAPPAAEDRKVENLLRPKSFDEFPGQQAVKNKLMVFIQAAKKRGGPLDHVLFSGPPGLGKTTLAYILGHQLGVEVKTTSGPALDKKGDLAAILTSLKPNTILFIDEIHRLNKVVEEYLYSAMEDFFIDIITGEGFGARTMRFKIAPFTLVGATTRSGLLSAPLRDRFGIQERLSFYNQHDLIEIVKRSSMIMQMKTDLEGAQEVAKRCRGTPRIANRLLRRVRDYADVRGNGVVNIEIAKVALNEMEVDSLGLDLMDRKILESIIERFSGGPVGIDTLSAALSEERDTLEEVYEPYLIQEGLLQKTPRGRIATAAAYAHLGVKIPVTLPQAAVSSPPAETNLTLDFND